jgi:hypothetical protein
MKILISTLVAAFLMVSGAAFAGGHAGGKMDCSKKENAGEKDCQKK